MGVPKFFRFFAERYPCIINSFDGEVPVSIDNLYLDMNGIIHVCSHENDDLTTGPSFDDMARSMCATVEKLFDVVKPKKNFVLCIDGVAPRAKMNQQRERRFRKETDTLEAIEKAKEEGKEVPSHDDIFDSNMISPGTEFMELFCEHFKFFLQRKLHTDPSWQGVNVVFSGHDSPGEGEHKIMDFIRARRCSGDYSPNEVHCLYGLDADLIMLALASHEAHVLLLREVVRFEAKRDLDRKEELKQRGIIQESLPSGDQYVLLQIQCFRDYLRIDMAKKKPAIYNSTKYEWDRCYNDFVIMCCLVGNDFLPSLPHITIRDDAVPVMIAAYHQLLEQGRYITNGKHIVWRNFHEFLRLLGQQELRLIQAAEKSKREYQERILRFDPNADVQPVPHTRDIRDAKDYYYASKLEFDWQDGASGTEKLNSLTKSWLEGISWVWEYYTSGPPSWTWYYPSHYAPFVSDVGASDVERVSSELSFTKGNPLLPYEQLFSVLPPSSIRRGLPAGYHDLHEQEHLKCAFPERLQVDRENATAPWEGVVVIPFLKEEDVLRESDKVARTLTPSEKRRNTNRYANLFRFDPHGEPRLLRSLIRGVDDLKVTVSWDDAFHCDSLVDGRLQYPPLPQRSPEARSGKAIGCASLFSMYNPPFGEVYDKQGLVTIFDKKTFRDSIILRLNALNADDTYTSLLGKWYWVDWPNIRQAKVVKIVYPKETLTLAEKGSGKRGTQAVQRHAHHAEKQREVERMFREHHQKLLTKRGIHVDITVMVGVLPLVGFAPNAHYNLERRAGDHELFFPLQLLVPGQNYDFIRDTLPQLQDVDGPRGEAMEGLPLMYLPQKGRQGQPPAQAQAALIGATGRITKRMPANVHVSLFTSHHPHPPPPASFMESIDMTKWMTIADLAKQLQTSSQVVDMVCGSITTTSGFGKREVGLCLFLKHERTQVARLGFAKFASDGKRVPTDVSYYMSMGTADCAMAKLADRRPGFGAPVGQQQGKWLVSPAAQGIITAFLAKFPSFRTACGGQSVREFDPNQLRTQDLLDKTTLQIIDAIEAWVRSQAHWGVKLVGASEDLLPEAIMSAVEDNIRTNTDSFHARYPPEQRFKKVKLEADPRFHDFYSPLFYCKGRRHLAMGPASSPTQEIFRLGVRVVNLKAVGPVPFGARGIVTRLLADGSTVEVVLDEEHFGCTRLGGRLKTYRGALLKRHSLLPIPSRPAKEAVQADLPLAAQAPVAQQIPTVAELRVTKPLPQQGRQTVEAPIARKVASPLAQGASAALGIAKTKVSPIMETLPVAAAPKPEPVVHVPSVKERMTPLRRQMKEKPLASFACPALRPDSIQQGFRKRAAQLQEGANR